MMSAAGTRHLEHGRIEEALKLYRVCAKAPFFRQYRLIAMSNLMVALHADERYQEALTVWDDLRPQLSRLRPYAGMAAASYAAVNATIGRYQEAVQGCMLEEALPDGPLSGLPLHCEIARCSNLVSALLSMGELDEAEAGLEQLRSLLPQHPILAGYLNILQARYLFRRGRKEEAAELAGQADLRSAAPLYQQELELNRALLLTVLGKPELGLLARQRAPECILNDRIRLLHMLWGAEDAYHNEDFEKALFYYRDAARLPYPIGQFLTRAANLASRLGRDEECQEFLALVLEKDPQSSWAKLAKERLDRTEKAGEEAE